MSLVSQVPTAATLAGFLPGIYVLDLVQISDQLMNLLPAYIMSQRSYPGAGSTSTSTSDGRVKSHWVPCATTRSNSRSYNP